MPPDILASRTSRRALLGGAAALAGATALAALSARRAPQAAAAPLHQAAQPDHRVWVWQFTDDGPPSNIANLLARTGLSVMMKTHDGLEWMARYDRHPFAIDGPAQVSRIADIFESRGVPFHAWCVVKGVDPQREAEMAANVLAAGARSLTIDLEDGQGFWYGSPYDARAYGTVLRSLAPDGRIDVSIDPRPWRHGRVPLREFLEFSDRIAPQCYWDDFNSEANVYGYAAFGHHPGDEGITPEFLVDTTLQVLAPYNRHLSLAGQGGCEDPAAFERFVQRVTDYGIDSVSAWRFGVTRPATLAYLGQANMPPSPTLTASPTTVPATPSPSATSAASTTPVPAATGTASSGH